MGNSCQKAPGSLTLNDDMNLDEIGVDGDPWLFGISGAGPGSPNSKSPNRGARSLSNLSSGGLEGFKETKTAEDTVSGISQPA